jgi:hypothetical protein
VEAAVTEQRRARIQLAIFAALGCTTVDLRSPRKANEAAEQIARFVDDALPPAWQPIETAPKDGTKILGYDPLAEDCVVIRWTGFGDFSEEAVCWRIQWSGQENPDCTHWIPLPEPPKP